MRSAWYGPFLNVCEGSVVVVVGGGGDGEEGERTGRWMNDESVEEVTFFLSILRS